MAFKFGKPHPCDRCQAPVVRARVAGSDEVLLDAAPVRTRVGMRPPQARLYRESLSPGWVEPTELDPSLRASRGAGPFWTAHTDRCGR